MSTNSDEIKFNGTVNEFKENKELGRGGFCQQTAVLMDDGWGKGIKNGGLGADKYRCDVYTSRVKGRSTAETWMDGWRREERPLEESSRSLSKTPLSSGPHSARSIQTPAHH